MMKSLLCVAALALGANPAAPAPGLSDVAVETRQEGTLEGTVIDARAGAGVAGAEVRLIVAGQTRITRSDGWFSFGSLDVRGPDTLVVRHLAYDSLRVAVEEGPDLGPLQLELHVEPRPVELEGLLVEAAAERAREEAQVLARQFGGRVWDRSDFERFVLAAHHVMDALRWSGMVVQVTEFADDERCVVIRAAHGCAAVYLNGVRVSQGVLNALGPEDVQSYVVLGPIDAMTAFGTGAAGGAVVIYTRR